MDLLESVLRAAKAEKFTGKFKENGIDTITLSLLVDEDLQLLGIEDPKIRHEILQRITTLQFAKEKKNNLLIDENYVLAVLGSINKQLLLHYASLSYAITNKDIVLCDVRLSAATECLLTSVDNLHTKIQDLKQLVCPEQKKSTKKYFVAIVTIPICLYFVVKLAKKIKW